MSWLMEIPLDIYSCFETDSLVVFWMILTASDSQMKLALKLGLTQY